MEHGTAEIAGQETRLADRHTVHIEVEFGRLGRVPSGELNFWLYFLGLDPKKRWNFHGNSRWMFTEETHDSLVTRSI